ncbi:MAG: calcium/sodium antiporter [Acidobacteriota bacterium]|nr:calcium/sodium antiporter [Acidobacteriota bacterium]
MIDLLLVAVGAVCLYFGGEGLVRGATQLARTLGLSPLVIGLTVVAFGTSSPELAATLVAVFEGSPQVAVGNVLGSNIANVGLILGASALLQPLLAQASFLRREIPFMVAVSVLIIPMAADGHYGRLDGLFLLALFALFLWVLLRKGEAPPMDLEVEDDGKPTKPVWVQLAMVVVGVVLLVVGAKVLITGAVSLARAVGLSEQVIGLSLVALGTSLPELAASLVAASHNEGDLVLGNVVGSNIFNVLLVLGTTVAIHPIPVLLSEFGRDLGVGLLFSIAVLPLLALGHPRRLSKREGTALLLGYVVYMWWIF